ncbi:MAG: YdbL family protein [Parvularculaceae bacterium]|nr:YdbL family protein [Parvularculaceae bacterium]
MKKFLATSLLVAFALSAAPALAASAAIDAAKARCVVGEQTDGYLGVIDAAKADETLKREVRSINQQRKAAYAELATRNGVTIEQAAQVTAERLLNGAPSGHCIQSPDGGWLKKP